MAQDSFASRPNNPLAYTAIAKTLEATGPLSESAARCGRSLPSLPIHPMRWPISATPLNWRATPMARKTPAVGRWRSIQTARLAHHTLANALKDQGRIHEAISAIRRHCAASRTMYAT